MKNQNLNEVRGQEPTVGMLTVPLWEILDWSPEEVSQCKFIEINLESDCHEKGEMSQRK